MSKPALGYWKIRGLAAQIRYVLHYANVDFDDVLYDVSAAPEFSRASWTDVKHTLGFDFPNLPYFSDGDFKLTESAAIIKYICKKWAPELLGADEQEYANAEMLTEFVSILKRNLTGPSYSGGAHGDNITTQLLANDCYQHVKTLNDWRDKKGFKWLAGNNLTFIDFIFWECLDYINWLSKGEVFKHFPNLEGYHKQWLEHERIANWWSDDVKAMKYPWNNAMAKIGGRDSQIHP